MNRSPQFQAIRVPGPVGSLEAILETPADDRLRGAAVVCHPHPQHGGTMHNKVAHTMGRAFSRMGMLTLRFNFRGTGESEGEFDHGIGEVDDALAALDWIRDRQPEGPLWLGGFSFGAAVAIEAAAKVDGLITVAPAVGKIAERLEGQPRCPWLIVQGDEDELVDVEETIAWVNSLEPGPELLVLSGAEHFFHGRLKDLREAVMSFVASAAPLAKPT